MTIDNSAGEQSGTEKHQLEKCDSILETVRVLCSSDRVIRKLGLSPIVGARS